MLINSDHTACHTKFTQVFECPEGINLWLGNTLAYKNGAGKDLKLYFSTYAVSSVQVYFSMVQWRWKVTWKSSLSKEEQLTLTLD